MVKDLVSGVVRGALGIYQTRQKEHDVLLQNAQDNIFRLEDKISDHKREIEGLNKIITSIKGENGRQRIEIIDLTHALKKEKDECSQYKTWWLDAANERNSLEKKIEDLNGMLDLKEIRENLEGTAVNVG